MPQVWQPSQLTRQQLEERRLAIQPFLLDQSRTPASLAEEFGVKPGTIRTWRLRLKARGSLEATLTTGRPTRLTDAQVAELLETRHCNAGPTSGGFRTVVGRRPGFGK